MTGANKPTPQRELIRSLGPSFYWAWVLLTLATAASFSRPYLSVGATMRAGTFATFVLAVIVVTPIADYFGLLKKRRLVIVSGLLTSLSSAAIFLLLGNNSVEMAILISGYILSGLGSAGLWLAISSRLASRDKGFDVSATSAVALAIAMYSLIGTLPHVVVTVFMIALPLLSGAALLVDTGGDRLEAPRVEPLQSSRRLIGRYVVLGMSLGLLLGLNSLQRPGLTGDAIAHLLTPIWGGIILAFGMGFIFWRRLDLSFLRTPTLPLIMTSLILLPFLGASSQALLQTAVASGWLCLLVLSAMGLPGVLLQPKATAREISVRGESMILAPFAMAWLIGNTVSVMLGHSINPWDIAFSAIAYVIAIATAIDVFARIIPRDREADRHTQEAVTLTSRRIAVQYSLTPREEEVLILLARGRSLSYIQKTLNISEGTTKTHVNHIHQKLGIHNREELLELVFPSPGKHPSNPIAGSTGK